MHRWSMWMTAALATLLHAPEGRAQLVLQESRSAALSGSVALPATWTAAYPASIAGTEAPAFLLHAGRPYSIPGLNVTRATATIPFAASAASAAVARTGYDEFSEVTASISAASLRSLAPAAALGLGARLSVARAIPRGYPAQSAAALDIGWSIRIDSVFALDTALHSVALTPHGHSLLPRSLLMSGSMRLLPSLLVLLRIEHDPRHPPSFGAGAEVSLMNSFTLRSGVATGPTQICGGFGLRAGPLDVGLAIVAHHALGISTSLTVQTLLRRK